MNDRTTKILKVLNEDPQFHVELVEALGKLVSKVGEPINGSDLTEGLIAAKDLYLQSEKGGGFSIEFIDTVNTNTIPVD